MPQLFLSQTADWEPQANHRTPRKTHQHSQRALTLQQKKENNNKARVSTGGTLQDLASGGLLHKANFLVFSRVAVKFDYIEHLKRG